MGHVVGAASGVVWVQLAANLVVASRRRPRRTRVLAVLRVLARRPTANEATTDRDTVARVLTIVRAQAAGEGHPG